MVRGWGWLDSHQGADLFALEGDALREAQHFKHRTTISERRAAALHDELHEMRRDLARLREELERANAWGAGVQSDNDTLRRDLARARDERDEARQALQCFERIVLNQDKS
mgnify:CR=1 FL=1